MCSVLSVALMTSPSHLAAAAPAHALSVAAAPLSTVFPGLPTSTAWTGGCLGGTAESDALPGRPWFPSCCYRGVMHATGRRRDIERHWRSRRGLELPVHAPDLRPCLCPAPRPSPPRALLLCLPRGHSGGEGMAHRGLRSRATEGTAWQGVAGGRDIRQPHACPDQPPPFFPRERGRGAKIFPPGATRFSQSREMRTKKNPATETKDARHGHPQQHPSLPGLSFPRGRPVACPPYPPDIHTGDIKLQT